MSGKLFLCLGAVVILGAATSYGQVNTTAGAHVPNHDRVNAVNSREEAIKKMIADGAQSGQLTENQADGFKHRLNQIQGDKTNAMTQRHGHLSKGEAKELKKREDELEHDIQASLNKS